MDLPHFPTTQPRDLPPLIFDDDGAYLGADPQMIDTAARYALALKESLDDAETMLEPLLPHEARPYVEVFERYLLARAEELMAQWEKQGKPANLPLEPQTLGINPNASK